MADNNLKNLAEEAIQKTLTEGQHIAGDGMSRGNVNLRDALHVMEELEKRAATRQGRRPLFRGINLSGMQP